MTVIYPSEYQVTQIPPSSLQLLATLSVFDLFGSMAYTLTSLPTPASDYIYGAKGNDAFCSAQGFFIQIGAIASYMNESLAVYYLLQIKYGWNERRFTNLRAYFFVIPIVVGLIFAFAGETITLCISFPPLNFKY